MAVPPGFNWDWVMTVPHRVADAHRRAWIEAGYTFQRALNGVRLYAVAQNLFTLTGYSGIDPTAGREGIDDNIFPRSRTFTAGINVRF